MLESEILILSLMQFFSMVWLMEVVCTAADKALYGNSGFLCTILQKKPWMAYSDIPSNVLSLFKTTVQQTVQHSTLSVLFMSVKKQSTGHWTSSSSNVQTSKSTCPRCFVFLLPLRGSHPLTPVISLSALKQTSLPDTVIYSGCLCRSHPWQGQRAEMKETYHMCKMSLNSNPVLLNAPSKCDPARKKILQLPHAVA